MDKILEESSMSYVFGSLSVLFGLHLLYYPFIFTVSYYRPIEIINSVFSINWIPGLLVIFGILKIVGAYFDLKRTRLISLISLSLIWIFFGIVFLLSYFASPNANVFFAASQIFLAYKIAQRSNFKLDV